MRDQASITYKLHGMWKQRSYSHVPVALEVSCVGASFSYLESHPAPTLFYLMNMGNLRPPTPIFMLCKAMTMQVSRPNISG